ncbi:MAG: hypothetical protein VX910_05925 [Candidatus Latescibacterota bacterium]|nr:hypothetical protein [Candidatus Latescibacterota bacterium]
MEQSDGATKPIDLTEIQRLTLKRYVVRQVLSTTVGRGLQGVLTGGTAGLFGLVVQWHFGLEEMKAGAAIGGIVGLGIRLLD